jgi:hypothetical protein
MASSLPPMLEIVTAPNQVNELTKDAIDYIDTISDPILFDEMLREEDKRDKQAKCSEIFGFTIRKLSPDECVKFKLDTSKNYQIITSIGTESVASVVGLKVGDVLIGVYNTNGQIRQLVDFVDEDALYNIYGNKLFDKRTILYINFRVLRYVYKNVFDFNLDYVDVRSVDVKTLHHTLRFALPYTNSDLNDTIINFGSAYFEKYIDGLTDTAQQMVGGAKGAKGKEGAEAATGASAAIPSGQGQGGVVVGRRPQAPLPIETIMRQINESIELEKTLPPGPQKTALQQEIAKARALQKDFMEKRKQMAQEKALREQTKAQEKALREQTKAQEKALKKQMEQQRLRNEQLVSSLFPRFEGSVALSDEQFNSELARYEQQVREEQEQEQEQEPVATTSIEEQPVIPSSRSSSQASYRTAPESQPPSRSSSPSPSPSPLLRIHPPLVSNMQMQMQTQGMQSNVNPVSNVGTQGAIGLVSGISAQGLGQAISGLETQGTLGSVSSVGTQGTLGSVSGVGTQGVGQAVSNVATQGLGQAISGLETQGAVSPVSSVATQGVGQAVSNIGTQGAVSPVSNVGTQGVGQAMSGVGTQGVGQAVSGISAQGAIGSVSGVGTQGVGQVVSNVATQGALAPVSSVGTQGVGQAVSSVGIQSALGPVSSISAQGALGPVSSVGTQGALGSVGNVGTQSAIGPVGNVSVQGLIVRRLKRGELPFGTLRDGPYDVTPPRILLMNLYLNVIFKTILSNNALKQKYDTLKTSNKPSYVPLSIQEKYMTSPPRIYELEVYPKTNFNDIDIINKLNAILETKLETAFATSGGGGYSKKNNFFKNAIKDMAFTYKKKQKTLKKKMGKIKNKHELENKINAKIKKYIKNYLEKKEKQLKVLEMQIMNAKKNATKQQYSYPYSYSLFNKKENKNKIKTHLNSKINKKINNFNKMNNKIKFGKHKKNNTRKNY